MSPLVSVLVVAAGIVALLVIVLKSKIPAFVALIAVAVALGLALGMDGQQVVGSVGKGFGNTLGSIGLIIGFGMVMGDVFALSHASHRMAQVFLKLVGRGREEFALMIAGFIVSIPIFCDSAFVVLFPIARSLAQMLKKSVVGLAVALALGLVVTHSIVPPTPGPLGVAGILGVDLGSYILWSLLLAIPTAIVPVLYIRKHLDRRFIQLVDEDGHYQRGSDSVPTRGAEAEVDSLFKGIEMPSAARAFFPLLVPILLILVASILGFVQATGPLAQLFLFLGNPVIAVGLATLIAIFTLGGSLGREPLLQRLDTALEQASVIIFVTGSGGALGQVLRDSGVGETIAQGIIALSIPPILLPLVISTVMRLIQGSGTVSMITATTLSAPILAATDANLIFAGLAAGVGSLFFGYFNDSYFWLINRTLGIRKTGEQLQVWSVTSTCAWAVGVVTLFVLNFLFG